MPPFCHSDRSVSGVEESTTLVKEPTQDKTCCLGRFLDSHSFARNDMPGGGSVLSTRVIFGALLGDESSPLHCVVPFNRTGCIRDVAGGRLPPLHARRRVVSFNRTGCIRNAAGGRLPPLHPFFNVIPFGRYGSIIATWRAASSRPYMRSTIAPIVCATFHASLPPSIQNCQLSTVNANQELK